MALLARISNWFHEQPAPMVELVDPEAAFDDLRIALEPRRARLVDHPLYDAVDTLGRLRDLMSVHVFAVWDFMCLAKRLQRELTSMTPLWRPPAEPELARFINGVIHGEESDVGPDGHAISHCELYLAGMEEVGASTYTFRRFLDAISAGSTADAALAAVDAPKCARAFVRHTLQTALAGDPVEVLASFLFGREDLIPDMFAKILPRWQKSRTATRFAYYVKRHIELDGDDHGPAARKALVSLAGTRPAAWAAARRSAERALDARIALWDRVHESITQA